MSTRDQRATDAAQPQTPTDDATVTRARTRRERSVVPHLARRRNDERGLTTLEWLLIVAAVAGLAALAVVLVQNVVDDTAEQLGGSSARETAAKVAADTVVREAQTADPADSRFNTWQKWELYFTARCERLAILYSDTNFNVTAKFVKPTNGRPSGTPTAEQLAAANEESTTATSPQTLCKRRVS